jgi:hypothetical protein
MHPCQQQQTSCPNQPQLPSNGPSSHSHQRPLLWDAWPDIVIVMYGTMWLVWCAGTC